MFCKFLEIFRFFSFSYLIPVSTGLYTSGGGGGTTVTHYVLEMSGKNLERRRSGENIVPAYRFSLKKRDERMLGFLLLFFFPPT